MPVLKRRRMAERVTGDGAAARALAENSSGRSHGKISRMWSEDREKDAASGEKPRSGDPRSLLPVCGNERCRTGWLRLWRRRQTPRFEGFWACSPECLEEMVRAAILRESGSGSSGEIVEHRHRVPLGLMLYAQGLITQEQLRAAVEAQRNAVLRQEPPRRIGRWLIQQASLDEMQLARALSAQWNCPLFSAERLDAAQSAQLMPRLLVETCGAAPLRQASSGRILMAFEDAPDHCLSLALERMHGVGVEAGVMAANEFRQMRESLMGAKFPKLRLMEVANRNVLARALARRIEHFQPMDAALVRVREYYWLRMWKTLDRDVGGAEDLLAVEATFS